MQYQAGLLFGHYTNRTAGRSAAATSRRWVAQTEADEAVVKMNTGGKAFDLAFEPSVSLSRQVPVTPCKSSQRTDRTMAVSWSIGPRWSDRV